MMEHSRKMAVISQSLLEKLQQQQELTDAPLAHLTDLDRQMNDILSNRNLAPDIKLKLYTQLLSRYTTIRSNELARPVQMSLQSPTHTENTRPVLPKPDLIASMPKNYRSKAKLLMDHINRHPEMAFTDKDELVYRGNTIEASNLFDLVNAYSRPASNAEPRGWKEFGQALLEQNVPRTAVGNKRLWEQIETPTTPPRVAVESPLVPQSTPEAPRRSQRKRHLKTVWTPTSNRRR